MTWAQPPGDHEFVRTNEPEAAAAARIGARRALRERSVLLSVMRPCFARTQTWQQAGKYISALASDLPSRNGWSVAEHAGDRTPDKSQRLLNRACWDDAAAMSQVRKYAAAGLDEAARRSRRRRMTIGALDETGQEKQGGATAGVKRQYMGCAGRVANGINTVYLSYVREKTGHALAGARQWIPAEDIKDPVKSLLTGLPLDLRFRTKGHLGIDVLTDARDRTDAQTPSPARPGDRPPADPGLIPLSVREVKRLLATVTLRPQPPGHAARWLHWRRRHQARSRWFHQRARLERNYARVP